VQFDLDQDGVAELIPWTSPGSDDAWLTLDRNGNGVVDDGSEFFGNYSPQVPSTTPNGFAALALYDLNGDGWIDRGDPVFSELRLWNDTFRDGQSERGELRRLAQAGIRRISTLPEQVRRQDQWGNLFRYRARIVTSRGSEVAQFAYDVFFVVTMPSR
jgi:hypothetical protein